MEKVLLELKNVSFYLLNDEHLCLVGPNGSGKTTIMKAILGFVKYEGQIIIHNKNFGFVFDEIPILQYLKVKEFLELLLSAYSRNYQSILEMINYFEVQKIENKLLKFISKGERKKIAIIFSLLNKPHFLIMDEPTSYIDPFMKEKFWSFINKKLKAFIFTTNDWLEAQMYAHRIVMLNEGRILTIDYKESLLKRLKFKNKILIEIKDHLPSFKVGEYMIIKNGYVQIYTDEIEKYVEYRTFLPRGFEICGDMMLILTLGFFSYPTPLH
jgi:ABC-2 type transport system ATP-binding protein